MKKLVVLNSIFALGFIALAFTVNWLFLVGSVILMLFNQKILTKK